MNALLNAPCNADAVYIDSDGLAPIALPEANVNKVDQCSDTGVSTRNMPDQNTLPRTHSSRLKIKMKDPLNWYALRTTYGREKKHMIFNLRRSLSFFATHDGGENCKWEKQLVEVSRLPNIFFAYGSEQKMKDYVYDNGLPPLSSLLL
ncbi:MAG: hypothetical protein KBT06_06500 [Prevotellaceae bacterium]|nr:hypothetical protein [Candidatus Colivivens equi]